MVARKPSLDPDEYKAVDLYEHDPMYLLSPSGYGRAYEKNRLNMKARGWEVVEETDSSIALFRRSRR